MFDQQIEEILMNKKSHFLKGLAKTSRISIRNDFFLQSPSMSPMIPLDFSLEPNKTKILEENSNEKQLLKVYPVKISNSTEVKESGISEGEEEFLEHEKNIKQCFIENLDRWLCFDGIRIVLKIVLLYF